MTEPITFVVPGRAMAARETLLELGATTKAGVKVGARRGSGEAVRVAAYPGEDIVLLRLANGPALYLHPHTARDLFRAQTHGVSSPARGAEPVVSDSEVIVPSQSSWRDLNDKSPLQFRESVSRGNVSDWISGIALDTVEVITGFVKGKAADVTAGAIAAKLDQQVDAGVYKLSASALDGLKGKSTKLSAVTPREDGGPLLILLHGTFVETSSTFGKLWQKHRPRVESLFRHYQDAVYALDHPTVSASPFANALTLVKVLPHGARLHCVTHSRGGLVAEVLVRVCGGQGLSESDLAIFKDPAYARHHAELVELAKEVQSRQIRIERLVRVACPARGTLLASRRLDAYLSVLKWGLELSGLTVPSAFVDFLAEVARRRSDPEEFPGLEAMMPERPVATWLNAPADPVAGDLRVVAGDVDGDSLTSWLKTLLSDAFCWTDNDLVVQTRSMYGGTPRSGGASFYLDRGGNVTHFSYFENERTADAVTRALIQDQPADFRLIGPLSWAGEDASGTRAARAVQRSAVANPADRPALFVLPGILGSHLKVDGHRVWLSARVFNGLRQLKWDPESANLVQPDGPVGSSYDKLLDYFAQTHEVIEFSFDWRRPMEDEAKRLAIAVEDALKVRTTTQQPVRLLAHSMGGVVARTMQLERPDIWEQMMRRPGARLLMLGTPNGGSYAPMQVLSGDDTFGNLLTVFGSLFDAHGARQLIAEMPGLVQLQADLIGGRHELDKTIGWQALEKADLEAVNLRVRDQSLWHNNEIQLRPFRWGVPPQEVLDQALALRGRLDKQRDAFCADASKMLLVVGKARSTPADVKVTDNGAVYLDAPERGDGRVTLESACLPGVKTWQVDAAHGDLPNLEQAFAAYRELLEEGDTSKLPRAVPGGTMRGSGAAPTVALVPNRPARSQQGDTPPVSAREVFDLPQIRSRDKAHRSAPLKVSVINGNLKFVREPLMLGHYQALKLTGTEAVIDRLLDGAMSESLRAGLYPSAVGSSQVFINTKRNSDDPFVVPRPQAAIVIGLGEEGALRMAALTDTVRQGVIAYAQRVAEQGGGGSTTFALATTLIGSGGSNMSTGTSAQAIVMGVSQANKRLTQVSWPQVSHLHLIELYTDRATEALAALTSLSNSLMQSVSVEAQIKMGLGWLARPLNAGYRGSDYDFISILQASEDAPLEFILATRRARDEVRGVVPQSKLVKEIIRAGANAANQDQRMGRTLFKLLVPIELEPFLAGSSSLLMQLDPGTASYPWELLDTQRSDLETRDDDAPWAIRTCLLRKLRTVDYRERPLSAIPEGGVLVIGEPECPPDRYPALPGACAEAKAVAAAFGIEPILKAGAVTILNAVLDGAYRILHVAGHGDFIDGLGGVILSNGTTFGPREVKAMRIVPELAFINCCHIGRFDDRPLQPVNLLGARASLPAFAANIAEALIRIGVRCVIAAGWAVDDNPAELFARRFYEELNKGASFVKAVRHARRDTWEAFPDSNTWAAYQCYGDPNWTYINNVGNGNGAREAPQVASADALALHLEALIAAHRYKDQTKEEIRTQLEQLESSHAGSWGGLGAIAEAFGRAYAEIDEFSRAIQWYERALDAEDGGARLQALEQLGNLLARRGAKNNHITEVNRAIDLLKHVNTMGSTVEREALLGSAYKRLAMLEEKGSTQWRAALMQSHDHYGRAEAIALATSADNLFYPAMNRMGVALMLGGSQTTRGFDPEKLAAVRRSLQQNNDSSPDFWSVIGLSELRIYEALSQKQLAGILPGVLTDIKDLKGRSISAKMWGSVADQWTVVLSAYVSEPKISASEKGAASTLFKALTGRSIAEGDAPPGSQSAMGSRRAKPEGKQNKTSNPPSKTRSGRRLK